MNHPVTLRKYKPADLEPVVRLFVSSVHEAASADYTKAQVAAWAPPDFPPSRWEQRLAEQEGRLAEIDGQLAGFSFWTADGYLDLLYVHPAWKRHGVAKALCSAAEQFLRGRLVPRIHTQASVTAQPFFLHQGFRIVRHQTIRLRGINLPNAVMEKRLDRPGLQPVRAATAQR